MLRGTIVAALCCLSFGSMALAAPPTPPPPAQQVAPALVKVLLASDEGNAKLETLGVAKSILVHTPPPPPKGEPAAKTLTAELVFDTSKEGLDVRKRYIELLESLARIDGTKNRPPIITFTWSSTPSFEGVLANLDVKYTLFLPDGKPTRATARLAMRESHRCLRDSTCASGQVCRSGYCVTPTASPSPTPPSSLAPPSSPTP